MKGPITQMSEKVRERLRERKIKDSRNERVSPLFPCWCKDLNLLVKSKLQKTPFS